VLELVDQLKAAGQEVNSLRLGEQVVAKTVCRHAVKANDPLAGKELQNLVEDLRRLRDALHLPSWTANAHRDECSRTREEIREDAISAGRFRLHWRQVCNSAWTL